MGRRKLREAEGMFRRVLAHERRSLPQVPKNIARTLNSLAVVLTHLGELPEARSVLAEAFKINRELPDGPVSIHSLHNTLAQVLLRQGKHEAAELEMRKSVELARSARPPDGDGVTAGLSNLAENKLAEAEKPQREALQIYRALGPSANASLVHGLICLADILSGQGELAKAHDVTREALPLSRRNRPSTHPMIRNVLNKHAFLGWRLRRYEAAATAYAELAKLHEAALGRKHRDTLQALANLGVNLRLSGRVRLAIPLLAEVFAASAQHVRFTWVGNELLVARAEAADPKTPASVAAVVDLSREVIQAHRARLPKESAALAGQLGVCIQALLEVEAGAVAEPLVREVLEILERVLPDGWHIFYAKAQLGAALLCQDKPDEAAPLLLEGYQGMKKRQAKIKPKDWHTRTRTLEWLVKLADANEDAKQAANWRTALEAERERQAKIAR